MSAASDRTKIIGEAAEWLSLQSPTPSPIIPVLRRRFDLSTGEAVQAIKSAGTLRQGRAQ